MKLQTNLPKPKPKWLSEVSRWIRRQVLCHKHILIPFHLPVFKVREQPHQSLKDFLHNFKDWDAWLQHNSLEHVLCPCHKYLHRLPEVCITHGHVVAGIEHLGALHQSYEKLGAGSASSAFLPAKHEFFKHNCKMFLRGGENIIFREAWNLNSEQAFSSNGPSTPNFCVKIRD